MNYKLILKRSLMVFFRIVIVLIGIGAVVFLLWEPWVEGVNAHATTLYQIYFDDPFLAYVYIASIPFFVTLYQAFRVLGYVRQNEVFLQRSVKALRTIKYCALSMIGFALVGEIFIMLGESDDRAGGVFMGVLVILGSILMATAAAMFERILKKTLFQKPDSK